MAKQSPEISVRAIHLNGLGGSGEPPLRLIVQYRLRCRPVQFHFVARLLDKGLFVVLFRSLGDLLEQLLMLFGLLALVAYLILCVYSVACRLSATI